jgi:periplasmic protein TonB
MGKAAMIIYLLLFSISANSQNSPARFPGGTSAWRRYLEREFLKHDIEDSCTVSSTDLSVIVSFVINKDGTISNVSVQNSRKLCPALVKEAMSVVKEGPPWIPALRKGKRIRSYYKQRITWSPAEI